MPDAYRSMLVHVEDLVFNITMTKQPPQVSNPGEVWFCIMFAMLFGLSSSVVQFGRWSRFLEALNRRMLWLLWCLFVDDSGMVDLKAGKGSAQRAGSAVFAALGVGVSLKKRQRMGDNTEFLGVVHDLSVTVTRQVIPHYPKPELVQKLTVMIGAILAENSCTPAQASKIRGLANWTATAQFQRLGRLAMRPLKLRQYRDTKHAAFQWALNGALRDSLQYVVELAAKQLTRDTPLQPKRTRIVVIASDAQGDPAPCASLVIIANFTVRHRALSAATRVSRGSRLLATDRGSHIAM